MNALDQMDALIQDAIKRGAMSEEFDALVDMRSKVQMLVDRTTYMVERLEDSGNTVGGRTELVRKSLAECRFAPPSNFVELPRWEIVA